FTLHKYFTIGASVSQFNFPAIIPLQLFPRAVTLGKVFALKPS
ncbi:unnamed protein product, partial [Discosporangium mesarthrocarpum]